MSKRNIIRRIPEELKKFPEVVWHSVSEVAEIYGRSPRTIRDWCVDGTIAEIHCPVYRDMKGRWLIGLPKEIHNPASQAKSA